MSEERKVKLDREDTLYIENIMLKEQNETLRHEMFKGKIKKSREELHDHLVVKHEIDLANYTFIVNDGILIVTPK